MSADTFIYLAEVTCFIPDIAATTVLRYSTGTGFITAAADTPAHTLYDPRLEQPVDVTRNIFASGTTTGRSQTGYGELTLLNPDAALDNLLPYAFDGRAIVVRRGLSTATALTDFTVVFNGTMEQAEFSTERITIKLRDGQARLQLPLQATKYTGTNNLPNGVEGVASDLAGKPKPLTFGVVKQVAPPLVNTARLVYQVHDGVITSLDGVYDRGVMLVGGGTYASEAQVLDDALAPTAGEYKVWLAGGLFRLGSSPAGTVTADVTQGATSADRTAAALYRLVLLRMGIASSDIRAADLTALDAENAAVLGVYVDSETMAADVVDQVANTVGAWWGVNIVGQYRIALLEKPFAVPTHTFTAADIIGPPVRQSLADPERGVPAYRVTVRYARYYTVQRDLAASVGEARRAELAQEWREATTTDAAVQTKHLLAAALVQNTLFATSGSAAAEAQRRLELRSKQRHRFDITALIDEHTAGIDLGDVVGLLHPRYGMTLIGDTAGQLFVVIGVTPDARTGRVRFTLWGNAFSTRNLVTNTGDELVTSQGDYLITGTG